MSLPGRGFDRLQPPWSTGAVAAAAKAAAAEAAAQESEDSRNSETFLMMHMHQWSRDSETEASYPPPPPQEEFGGLRRHSKSTEPGKQSQGSRAGSSDHGRGRVEVVPEEVPIMSPGLSQGARHFNSTGLWPEHHGEGFEDMSTLFPASGPSTFSRQLLPWLQGLHGRNHLPSPPADRDYDDVDDDVTTDTGDHHVQGYEQGHYTISVSPPPAPGQAMPPAMPPDISPGWSSYSSPRGLTLPAPPPAVSASPWHPQAAAEVVMSDREGPSSHTYFNPLMPWRHAQHQFHPEDTPPIWDETPTVLPWRHEVESAYHDGQVNLGRAPIPRRLPEVHGHVRQNDQAAPCPMPSPSPAYKVDRLHIPVQSSVLSPLQVDTDLDSPRDEWDQHAAYQVPNLASAAVHPRASRVSFNHEVEEMPAAATAEQLAPPPGRSSLGSVKSAHSVSSLSRLLSPKRKEMLKMKHSFKASGLPVLYQGNLLSQSMASFPSPESRPSRLAVCCKKCWEVACCKRCWETKSLMIPCCTFLLSLLFACGLAVLLWMADTPDVTEGAFGLICQTDRGAPINFTYFEKAREHAIASLSVLENAQGTASTQTRFAIENNTRAWRHVEILFSKTGGELLTQQNVEAVRHIERKLMDLPGWKRLCSEKVPPEAQQYCNPGDSFAAVIFGSNQAANKTDAAMGALSKVVYDGRSSSMVMPLEQFIQYLKDFQQTALKRWFALTGPEISNSPMRTTYAFYLPLEDFEEWDAFVRDELEPLLHEEAVKGDGNNFDGTGYEEDDAGVRVFYRADGLKSKEFVRAVAQDAPLRFVACIAVLLGILLTSRRILLAFAGAVLSLTAPLAASTLAAGRGPTGNLEYPATTVAAWFIVAISCGELALATANAWEVKDTAPALPRLLRTIPRWESFVYRLLRFTLEVPTPTLAPAISLFLCSLVVDMPLVTEFTLHVGLGIAAACVLGVLVFPPACEFGDKLRERALNSLVMNEMQESTYGLMPFEFGGQPDIVAKLEALMNHLMKALRSKTVRSFAFLVFLAVFVGVSFEETSPIFVSEAPELFHVGHRLRVGPKVRELFGSGELLGGTGAPAETMRFARKCTPDAYDKLECSWYKCEVDGRKNIEEGKCSCFKQTKGSASDIRKCGAVVRFAALPPGSDAFAKVSFWRWAEEEMGVFIVNNSISSWPMGTLEMESWATGLVTTETQMVVKTHGADGLAPAWEDACLRVLCYCGPTQCKLDKWQKFGEPTITDPDRRLQLQTAVGRPNRDDDIEVYIVWGLKPASEIPRKFVKTHHEFGDFRIEDPWVQRNVHSFCNGLHPRLHVYEQRCWVLDFKRWLRSRGDRFPVPAADFYSRFHHFAAHYADLRTQQPGQDTYNYFWLNKSGKIQGCFAKFRGYDGDNLGLDKYRKLWMLYIFRRNVRNAKGTGFAWQASPQFAAHEAAIAVQDAAKSAAALSLICPILTALFLTCSLGLTLAIVLIEGFALCLLLCIGVGLGIRDFGPMEACSLVTFMALLVTPLIRVAHQYALARDGAGDQPKDESGEGSDNPAQFRPRSASISGGDTHPHFTSAPIVVHNPWTEGQDEEYLVDNSELKAKTCGLGYRLSPNFKDLDTKSRGYTGLAPWGSTVVGKRYLHDWIKVGERFLPSELQGCPVLILQESGQPPERFFSPESSATDTCMEDLKLFFLGPCDAMKLWSGAPPQERKHRTLNAVRRTSHTVVGASVAGIIAGIGLLPMHMEALGKIGLAALCAAVTVPATALGLLPLLTMTPLFGPSRVKRRAWVEFIEWVLEGRPRGSLQTEDASSTSADGSSSNGDTRTLGEMSAEVLGWPFSLTVKSFVDHLPDDMQKMVGRDERRYHDTVRKQVARSSTRLRSTSYDE